MSRLYFLALVFALFISSSHSHGFRPARKSSSKTSHSISLPTAPEPHLLNVQQITTGGTNAEAYWSFDEYSPSLLPPPFPVPYSPLLPLPFLLIYTYNFSSIVPNSHSKLFEILLARLIPAIVSIIHPLTPLLPSLSSLTPSTRPCPIPFSVFHTSLLFLPSQIQSLMKYRDLHDEHRRQQY